MADSYWPNAPEGKKQYWGFLPAAAGARETAPFPFFSGSQLHTAGCISPRSVSLSLQDDVGLDVEEQVVVAAAHLQQQGGLLQQRLLQVGGVQQDTPVQLHDDVTVPDPAPAGTDTRSAAFWEG